MNSNYDVESDSDLDFDNEESSDVISNDIADFELDTDSLDNRKSKHCSKRSFLAKQKIERLQEERRLKKLDENYYDDWD